jgi:hypothetical protein
MSARNRRNFRGKWNRHGLAATVATVPLADHSLYNRDRQTGQKNNFFKKRMNKSHFSSHDSDRGGARPAVVTAQDHDSP